MSSEPALPDLEIRQHPGSFPYEDYDFGGSIGKQSLLDILGVEYTHKCFELVLNSDEAPQTWGSPSRPRGQARRTLPSAQYHLRRLNGPDLYREVFQFVGLRLPSKQAMAKTLEYLSQIQPMQRPQSTELYSRVVTILENAKVRGTQAGWAPTSNLTPDDLDLGMLLALAIYGTTEDGYGALPDPIISLLKQTGLAWILVDPELQEIPGCWKQWAMTVWFTYNGKFTYDMEKEAENESLPDYETSCEPEDQAGHAQHAEVTHSSESVHPAPESCELSQRDNETRNDTAEDEDDPLHPGNWPLRQSTEPIPERRGWDALPARHEPSYGEIQDAVLDLHWLQHDLDQAPRPQPVDFKEYCNSSASGQEIRSALEALAHYVDEHTQRLCDETRVQAIVGDEMRQVMCDAVLQETRWEFEKHEGLHSRHRHAMVDALADIKELQEEVGEQTSNWNWTWRRACSALDEVARFDARIGLIVKDMDRIRQPVIKLEKKVKKLKKLKKLKRRVRILEKDEDDNRTEINLLKLKVEAGQMEQEVLKIEITDLRGAVSDRDGKLDDLEVKMMARFQSLQAQHDQQFRALSQAQHQIMDQPGISPPSVATDHANRGTLSAVRNIESGNGDGSLPYTSVPSTPTAQAQPRQSCCL